MSKDADMKMVEEAAQKLSEHFDSVQIFVTSHEMGEHDGTMNINLGVGNWFTRYGQVSDWLIRKDEQARKYIREEQ